MGWLGGGRRGDMPAIARFRPPSPRARRTVGVLGLSAAAHIIALAVFGSQTGTPPRPRPEPPLIIIDYPPRAPEVWPSRTRRAATDAAPGGPAARRDPGEAMLTAPLPRDAPPGASAQDVPEQARAQGVEPIWRDSPQSTLAERLGRIPPGLIAGAPVGGVPLSWRRRCNLPLSGPISEADRRACEQSFLAEAEPPPSMRRQRPQGDPRDQFAAQGARNLAEYEAQREPLAGGSGIVGSGECPGGNLGMGCAGAHLQGDMRQGATTNIRQRGNKRD